MTKIKKSCISDIRAARDRSDECLVLCLLIEVESETLQGRETFESVAEIFKTFVSNLLAAIGIIKNQTFFLILMIYNSQSIIRFRNRIWLLNSWFSDVILLSLVWSLVYAFIPIFSSLLILFTFPLLHQNQSSSHFVAIFWASFPYSEPSRLFVYVIINAASLYLSYSIKWSFGPLFGPFFTLASLSSKLTSISVSLDLFCFISPSEEDYVSYRAMDIPKVLVVCILVDCFLTIIKIFIYLIFRN